MSVEHTRFEASTDSKGLYVIDYVPGDVEITFSKNGYESTGINLKIQAAAAYPAADISLTPVPQGDGMLILAKDGALPVLSHTMQRRSFQADSQYAVGMIRENHNTWSVDSAGTEVREQRPLEIMERVDRTARNRLFSVGATGVIIDFWNNFFTIGVKRRMAPINEQVTARGDFIVHTVNLGPGRYAYVRWMNEGTPGLDGTPVGSNAAYVFTVK